MSGTPLPDTPEVAEARRLYADAAARLEAIPRGKQVPLALLDEVGYRHFELARLVRKANGTGGPGTALLDIGKNADELVIMDV